MPSPHPNKPTSISLSHHQATTLRALIQEELTENSANSTSTNILEQFLQKLRAHRLNEPVDFTAQEVKLVRRILKTTETIASTREDRDRADILADLNMKLNHAG